MLTRGKTWEMGGNCGRQELRWFFRLSVIFQKSQKLRSQVSKCEELLTLEVELIKRLGGLGACNVKPTTCHFNELFNWIFLLKGQVSLRP